MLAVLMGQTPHLLTTANPTLLATILTVKIIYVHKYTNFITVSHIKVFVITPVFAVPFTEILAKVLRQFPLLECQPHCR